MPDGWPAETAPRPGRPAQLDVDKLVAVAMRMDPERLTMSAVAAELGVTKSALYRWVTNREQLLDLVSDDLRRRMEAVDRPTASGWRVWLVEHGRRMHAELLALPGFAARLLTGPHNHGPGESPGEATIAEAFELGGADPLLARQYAHIYSMSIISRAAVEQNPSLVGHAGLDIDLLLDVVIRGCAAHIATPD